MTTALHDYIRASQKENYAQFRSGRLIIATVSGTKLEQQLNASKVDTTPDFSRSDSVIVTLANGHKEHWFNPTLETYRKAHLAFFSAAEIHASKSVADAHHVDHAFAKSAFKFATGLVKANFILAGVNSSYGASWEKRYRYRVVRNNGLCIATFVDLLKAVGIPLDESADPFGSMFKAVDTLIYRGIAPPADRPFLIKSVKDQMADKQDQDTECARRDGYDV